MLRQRIMSRLYIIMVWTLLFIPLAATGTHKAIRANEQLLQRLDSIIEHSDTLEAVKEARISAMRSRFHRTRDPRVKLEQSMRLYDEYLVYDSDSAIRYAAEASRLARRLMPDNAALLAACNIKEAYALGAGGFFDDAVSRLEKVNPEDLSIDQRVEYYITAEYVYSMRTLYLQGCRKTSDSSVNLTLDSRMALIDLSRQNHPEVLWIPIAMAIECGNVDHVSDSIIANLRDAVEASAAPSRQTAINSYWLGRYYQLKNDEEQMIHYLAVSAINDALIENRDIASVIDLADWLFHNGDRLRGYNYYVYSSDQVSSYHNRNRLLNMAEKLAAMRDAYHDDVQLHDRRMKVLVGALLVLLLGLIVAAARIVRENRRLKQARTALSDVNGRLKNTIVQRDSAIKALEKTNNELTEANDIKRGVVAFAFQLTADHINAIDDFRKKLLRKYKLNQQADIATILEDTDLNKERYRDFYRAFDSTVLSIFPRFVEEYNADQPEEFRADASAIEKAATLNTRQRIYALRRLGVEKSADIARMLNVSIRTVYNNRNQGVPAPE